MSPCSRDGGRKEVGEGGPKGPEGRGGGGLRGLFVSSLYCLCRRVQCGVWGGAVEVKNENNGWWLIC